MWFNNPVKLARKINKNQKMISAILEKNDITDEQRKEINALLAQDQTQDIIKLLQQDKLQEILNILHQKTNLPDKIDGLIVNEAADIVKKNYELKQNWFKRLTGKGFLSCVEWFLARVVLIILPVITFVWMVGMPFCVYQEAKANGYWIQKQANDHGVEKLTVQPVKPNGITVNLSAGAAASINVQVDNPDKMDKESGNKIGIQTKTSNSKEYIILVAVLFFSTIVYLTVLSVLGYVCKIYIDYFRKKELEQELKEEYEPKLRKLLFYKKYRDQYGDEVVKNIINKLYPNE